MIPVRVAFFSWRNGPLRRVVFHASFLAAGCLAGLIAWSNALGSNDPVEDASVFPSAFRQADPAFALSDASRQSAKVFARYYEGLTFERAGMIDAALDAYEKALKEAPHQQRLAYRASELAGQFRDIERGLQILEDNYRRNPQEAEACIRLSDYLTTYHENRKDRLDRALAILQEASTKFPQNPQVCDSLVQALLLRQENAAAQAVLDKAMAQEIDRPDYWLHVARIAPRVYRREKGTGNPVVNALYEKALRYSNSDVQIGTQVGDYFRLTEQYDRAKEIYQQIIARHPEEIEVRERLAAIHSILGDEDQVLAVLLDLERINPHRLETQRLIAQLYLKREEWSKSIEHYLKAFRISQGTVQEYAVVAQMLRMESRSQESIDLLNRARFHYPEELDLMVELAISHNAAEDYATALKTFQETEKIAEKLRPDLLNDVFYFAYGAAAERSKKLIQAEELFRKSISLAPEDSLPSRAARPYNYLGYMWLEQDKNIEEAGELILRANELMPGQGAYVDSLGWFYFKSGDFLKALETLLEAERLLAEEGDHDSVIFDHIAQSFFKLGHKQRALDYLQKAVDLDPENQEYRQRMKEYQAADKLVPVPLEFLDGTPATKAGADPKPAIPGEENAPAKPAEAKPPPPAEPPPAKEEPGKP